jgi:hypothetical protein
MEKDILSRSRESVSNDSFESPISEENVHQQKSVQLNRNSHRQAVVPIIGVVSILAAISFNIFLDGQGTTSPNNNYDEKKFSTEMINLGERYKVDDHSIMEIETGN